jgi:hypothetical protein
MPKDRRKSKLSDDFCQALASQVNMVLPKQRENARG